MSELPNRQDFINSLVNDTVGDTGLRKKLLKNPRGVIEERVKFKIPDEYEIAVHEDTPRKLNFVIPVKQEELTEAELEAVSGGGCYAYVPQCEHGPCPTALD